MRQLHFVSTTALNGGGEAVATLKYSLALAHAGINVTLVSRNIFDNSIDNSFPNINCIYLPYMSNAIADSLNAYNFITQYISHQKPDLIHIHGLWLPFLALVAMVAKKYKISLVISPHGCLEPWALNQKRLKKRLALLLYQFWVLRSASMFMVTSDQECNSVRRMGFTQPISIVPNGVDIPIHFQPRTRADIKTILFLSRIHPGKGLLDLVEAWSSVRQPGWRIVIAGGDEDGHQAEVENLIHQKGLASDFAWAGFVNGEAKQACFAHADVFVLPTYSENFGIAIAEALAHGLPVITTTGAPWPGLLTYRCGWWVEPGVQGIACALTQALACSPDELQAMGQRGRQWVAERYAWAKIGTDAALAGAWLLDRSQPQPYCVDTVASYN
jgi:glycosyltransferase involved in cell wall biosynthesis